MSSDTVPPALLSSFWVLRFWLGWLAASKSSTTQSRRLMVTCSTQRGGGGGPAPPNCAGWDWAAL